MGILLEINMGNEETWTDAFLQSMRSVADPSADQLIEKLFKKDAIDGVNQLLSTLLHSDDLPSSELPEELRKFLSEVAIFPDWADEEKIALGQRVFTEHGILALVSLLCASLPECYTLGIEARVLGVSRRLELHAYRRILETSNLAVQTMVPGGLGPQGKGFRSAQKVRLMHAAMRHLIVQPPPSNAAPASDFLGILSQESWDTESLGLPICQEDMAYTLMTFAWVTLRSFRRLGLDLGQEEEEAFLHAWLVIGFIMGVHPDLLPENVEQSELLFERIKARQQAETEAGKELTQGVLTTVREVLKSRHLDIPWLTDRFLPRLVIRELISTESRRGAGHCRADRGPGAAPAARALRPRNHPSLPQPLVAPQSTGRPQQEPDGLSRLE